MKGDDNISTEIFAVFMMCFISYVGVTLGFILTWEDLSLFNPIRNYNKWTQFNWFGIIVLTILINIILLPYAIIYWVYKLLTVGRKR